MLDPFDSELVIEGLGPGPTDLLRFPALEAGVPGLNDLENRENRLLGGVSDSG